MHYIVQWAGLWEYSSATVQNPQAFNRHSRNALLTASLTTNIKNILLFQSLSAQRDFKD